MFSWLCRRDIIVTSAVRSFFNGFIEICWLSIKFSCLFSLWVDPEEMWLRKQRRHNLSFSFLAGILRRSSSCDQFLKTAGMPLLSLWTLILWINYLPKQPACFFVYHMILFVANHTLSLMWPFVIQVVFLELCSSRVTVLQPQNLKVPL